MTTYRVGIGHDIALGSLTVLSPQPRSPGLQPADRSYAADGSVYEQGAFVRLMWSHFATAADYVTVLTAFGLDDTYTSRKVTVYVRDAVYDWVRHNGVAIHPRIAVDGAWEKYFPRGFVIYVNDLEALEEP